MKLVVRYQFGGWSGFPARALNLSVRLMQRLCPDAEFHITSQGPCEIIPGVNYHQQASLYSCGRFIPERFDIAAHELFLESDHILWEIPPGMSRWLARDDATLAWIVDWSYNAEQYATRIGDFLACPGMYGLSPGDSMPGHGYQGEGIDMVEQGHIAAWLKEHPPHEIVTHEEVSAYMPNHDILRHTHSKLGTHGVHLPGLNRGWSADGEKLIAELERKYL
jgi:hypothetical protein